MKTIDVLLVVAVPLSLIGAAYIFASRKFQKASQKLAINNDIDTYPSINSIEHCYTSARLSRIFGTKIAKFLGDTHEYITNLDQLDIQKDSWRDRWNNSVGRQIYTHCKNHDSETIETNVINACRQGQLINSIADPRINLNIDPNPIWRPGNVTSLH